jgi:uncharacterized DUF497 family protein
VNIEWDEEKNQKNIKKHRVSFELAAYIFTDPHRKEAFDDKHSSMEEDRMNVIGFAKDCLLIVSFIEPDSETIRIISARKAKKHERSYYGNC